MADLIPFPNAVLMLHQPVPRWPVVVIDWYAEDGFSVRVDTLSRFGTYAILPLGETVANRADHQDAVDVAYRWARVLGHIPVLDYALTHETSEAMGGGETAA